MTSRARKLILQWTVGLTLLAVAAVGGFAYKERERIRRKIDTWRVNGLVEKAATLRDQGNVGEAHEVALAAQRLNRASYPALELLYRTGIEIESDSLAATAAALFLHHASDRDDKLEALETLLDLEQYSQFAELFRRIPNEHRTDADAWYLEGRFFQEVGERRKARELVEAYFDSGGEDDRLRLLEIELLLNPDAGPSSREKGQRKLARRLELGGAEAAEALHLLWDYPVDFIRSELFHPVLVATFQSMPGAGVREQLALTNIELARAPRSPERTERLIREAMTKHGKEAPEDVAIWLAGLKRPRLVLEVLDEEAGMASITAYDVRLRALGEVHGIDAAEEWLADPHPDSIPVLVSTARAKIAIARDEPIAVINHLREAMSEAGRENTRRAFLNIFAFAVDFGRVDYASEALAEAAQRPGPSFPRLEEVWPQVRYLSERGDFPALRAIFQAIAVAQPDHPIVLNNLAYANLVLGENEEAAVERSRALVAERPEVMGFRTTLAFGLMMQGEWEEAWAVLEESEFSIDQVSAAGGVIYALALEKQGRIEEAQAVREALEWSELSNAEQRALAALRQKGMPEERGSGSLEELLREIETANQAGQRAKVLELVSRALFQAEVKNERDAFLQIHEVAMDAGLTDYASRALVQAARRSGERFPSEEALASNLENLEEKGDFAGLRQVLQVAVAREPGNKELEVELIYCRLILGGNPEALVRSAREWYQRDAGDLRVRTTFALGLMESGEWEEAKELLGEPGISWSGASASDLAIRATALREVGEGRRLKLAGDVEKRLSASEMEAFARLSQAIRAIEEAEAEAAKEDDERGEQESGESSEAEG